MQIIHAFNSMIDRPDGYGGGELGGAEVNSFDFVGLKLAEIHSCLIYFYICTDRHNLFLNFKVRSQNQTITITEHRRHAGHFDVARTPPMGDVKWNANPPGSAIKRRS